jgi:hypothetical protein
MQRCVFAGEKEDITVDGKGVLEGKGKAWWTI